ncbi:peptidase M20 domain-containing protein 2, partial [Carlito syrichta]|uniref:Peptidase M20 domain-containing protein 2 n=1 Tax=Carlito syrichta TaxID=1868482 RepID=A0A3Q0E0E3_CARSF
VSVLGTPAEEDGGGKIDLIEAGAFQNLDVVFMAHPSQENAAYLPDVAEHDVTVKYYGKASHAAAYPWEGVNALDAAVLAYNNLSVLRQQMKPAWRVHGIIKNGGVKPNIIPSYSELIYYFRAPSMKELQVLTKKAEDCFRAAASATGCTVEIKGGVHDYYNVLPNKTLWKAYMENGKKLGIEFISEDTMLSGPSAGGTPELVGRGAGGDCPESTWPGTAELSTEDEGLGVKAVLVGLDILPRRFPKSSVGGRTRGRPCPRRGCCAACRTPGKHKRRLGAVCRPWGLAPRHVRSGTCRGCPPCSAAKEGDLTVGACAGGSRLCRGGDAEGEARVGGRRGGERVRGRARAERRREQLESSSTWRCFTCFLHPAGSQEAQFYTLRTAKALAMTALDVVFKPELLERIREDFKSKLQEEQFLNSVE